MKLGVIVGSTRPNRRGGQIGAWAAEQAAAAPDIDVDLIDLAEVALPFLDEDEEPASGSYRLPHTLAWARRIDQLDGVLIVTAEYNSSFPAPLKNALDVLGPEWQGMPVAIVAYGGTSAGTRASQSLLPVLVSLDMLLLGAMHLPHRARFREERFVPTAFDHEALDQFLARMIDITDRLQRSARMAS